MTNIGGVTQSWMMQNPYNQSKSTDKQEIRSLLRNLGQDSPQNPVQNNMGNAVVNSVRSYNESLKASRQQRKNAALEVKKLRYQYKDISSKIIRSKTSSQARQVVSQARREVLRLKRAAQAGGYDDEELQAAIAHAKAMERVARKKVKHLEEEEMAKASGGICADYEIEKEEAAEEEALKKEAEEAEEVPEEYAEELPEEFIEDLSADFVEDMPAELLEGLSEDLLKEFSEEMQELMDEMGLDELLGDSVSVEKDMDPEDLKALKIKHRNKEMKDIVKADAEYLKAIFDHLEKMKSGGGAVMPQAMPMIAEPSIDISL